MVFGPFTGTVRDALTFVIVLYIFHLFLNAYARVDDGIYISEVLYSFPVDDCKLRHDVILFFDCSIAVKRKGVGAGVIACRTKIKQKTSYVQKTSLYIFHRSVRSY
jgi:hypothetical protein